MRFALFREVPKRQRRKKRKLNSGAAARKGSDDGDGSDDGESESDDDDDEPASADRMATPKPATRSAAAPARPPEDPIWGDESQDVQMAADDLPSFTAEPPAAGGDGKVRPERYVSSQFARSDTNPFRAFSFLLGCNYSVIALPIFLRRVCKMKKPFSWPICSRLSTRACLPIHSMELLKQHRFVKLWERLMS